MKHLKNKQIIFAFVFLLSVTIGLNSCKEDDPEPVEVSITDFSTTLDENPENGKVLGTVAASVNRGEITLQLVSQNPAGAMAIDAATGELIVANAMLFDFETHPVLKATISATAAGVSQPAEVTVNLTDVAETVMTTPFAITIDENPTANQVLGMVSATSDAGASLTYSIVAGAGNATAFAINPTTGELSVADVSQFDFETNPTLSANYEANNGVGSQQGTITVSLNDVDESNPDAFIVVATTVSDNEFVFTPTKSFGAMYNFNINWGDGNSQEGITSSIGHKYVTAGTYQIEITGDFPAFKMNTSFSEIKQWGNFKWESMADAFSDTDGLILPSENPDLSDATDLSSLFFNAKNVSNEIVDWDVSAAENFSFAFAGRDGSSANPNSADINVDISGWDVSSAVDLSGMFSNNVSFNQDIGKWDVSKVEDMNRMFSSTDFFNQDISDWDVKNVTNMSRMFSRAAAFDQNIAEWDVTAVNNMDRMFFNSIFNQNIGGPDGWDVSNVTRMVGMFEGNPVFNQNLNAWDMSNVQQMREFLEDAVSFDQDLSDWNLSGLADGGALELAFSNTNISVANYDALLNGWANNSNTPDNILFDARRQCTGFCSTTTLNYSTAGVPGRDALIAKGWQFLGDAPQ